MKVVTIQHKNVLKQLLETGECRVSNNIPAS